MGQTVIVLNIEDGRAKGSARSVDAVDIFEALGIYRDFFIAFGGHAGAAGMTLEVEQLSDLSQRFWKIMFVKKVQMLVARIS